MSKVAIIEANYENCHEAIEEIFNRFPLDLEGKKVVIKPNVLRSATPEEGVTTHPAVLKAVVHEVVKRHPASLIVGDNPGVFSYGMNEKAFEDTGLMDSCLLSWRLIPWRRFTTDCRNGGRLKKVTPQVSVGSL